jgi:hypothetical protein
MALNTYRHEVPGAFDGPSLAHAGLSFDDKYLWD